MTHLTIYPANLRRKTLVLQRVRGLETKNSLDVAAETQLLLAARRVGVPAARVVGGTDSPDLLGLPFIIVEAVAGQTIPQRILADPSHAAARARLAHDYGAALGLLQQIPLSDVPALQPQNPLEHYRRILDEMPGAHPALELGYRWLVAERPAPTDIVVELTRLRGHHVVAQSWRMSGE